MRLAGELPPDWIIEVELEHGAASVGIARRRRTLVGSPHQRQVRIRRGGDLQQHARRLSWRRHGETEKGERCNDRYQIW